jgi:hypothetical protein
VDYVKDTRGNPQKYHAFRDDLKAEYRVEKNRRRHVRCSMMREPVNDKLVVVGVKYVATMVPDDGAESD